MTWNGSERRKERSVLIIDDDADTRTLYEFVAVKMGMQAKAVSTPYAFIEEYETGKYDFALVDFMIDSYDGVDLIRLLDRHKAENTKIYLMTHYDKTLVKRKLNGDKISGLLSKDEPFKDTLTTLIKESVCEHAK